EARNKILSSLPVPPEAPEDSLTPILLPNNMTLQDFVQTLPVVRILNSSAIIILTHLGNFKALYEPTTCWSTGHDEHGYFLAPVFKCSTDQRTITVHRWALTDPMKGLTNPTHCFYQEKGAWYYAGVYQCFRFPDLSVREWTELSDEATQSIAKETLAARRNTSPQHFFEVKELYGAGALAVACVGLQCVGFNRQLHQALLEQKVDGRSSAMGLGMEGGRASPFNGNRGPGMASPSPFNPAAGVFNPGSASPFNPGTPTPFNGGAAPFNANAPPFSAGSAQLNAGAPSSSAPFNAFAPPFDAKRMGAVGAGAPGVIGGGPGGAVGAVGGDSTGTNPMAGGGGWNLAAGDLVSSFEALKMVEEITREGQENVPMSARK
ncbi:hypothetical protein EV121DRAFT_201651, partial [Schizophyllum commune]